MSLVEMRFESGYKYKNSEYSMKNIYLDVGKEKQRAIVRDLKNKSGMSWTKLAKFLGVGRNMVLFYNNGTYRLPYSSLLKLCEATNTNVKKYDPKFTRVRNKSKTVALPKLSEDFAEFLGILYGDGCLSKNYGVYVTCNAISDRLFVLNVVRPLFEKLFKSNVAIRIKKNATHCRLYSKSAYKHLVNFGFPEGIKKNQLRIPIGILKNKKYSLAFLRGLFDTDGGFHRHHKQSAQVEYTSHSPEFLKQVWKLLADLGFNVKLGKKQIWILDKNEIDKFFKNVKPNNPKHQYKYKEYKETGIVPLHREISYNLL